MTEVYYSTHDVSKFCNVYPSTVINWITEGILPAFTTPGGHRRIKKSDLIRLMKRNGMPLPKELVEKEKHRVLVVDDDLNILKMIETILKSEDILEVATVKGGFEAGVMVVEWKPDIILLDILMPEIDGYEVCQRIRQTDETKDIPIIAVTALNDEKEIKKMFAAGVTDHIAKPFKAQELIGKTRKYLGIEEVRSS